MTDEGSDTGGADSGTEGTAAVGQPNTPSALATAPLPQSGGVQSTHGGGLINNGSSVAQASITATLDDGQGNTPSSSNAISVAPGTSATFDTITLQLPFSNYQSGSTVTFVATTMVTDGTTTANDTQSNSISIP